MQAIDVIHYWFEELTPQQWWIKDNKLDMQITNRFAQLHRQAMQGELFRWRETALGSLAEVIVLDQFSRNIYRDTAKSFAADPLALALAQQAISKSYDKEVSEQQRGFFYLPFMHSESVIIHKEAVKLYKELGNENNLSFELQHQAIIERFGRYPHRNSILGRQSTSEEQAFLKEPGSSF
ncbi:DUF924 family protein [Thalassotalea euphylliae]|uniref:DUF924 family protein n=1 Tax=Thalassotalea euphylliae TaxID=1655234 RepID=UPI0036251589